MLIRTERHNDYERINEIHQNAFHGESEATLVNAVRNSNEFIPDLSLVAVTGMEHIVGHILISTVWIQTDKQKLPTLALAPMAVDPSYQNKGIGSSLVKAGIKEAKQLGHSHIVVLGHPTFYPKFGFVPSVTKQIHSPFPVPDEVFMILELKERSLKDIKGIVVYPPSFQSVT